MEHQTHAFNQLTIANSPRLHITPTEEDSAPPIDDSGPIHPVWAQLDFDFPFHASGQEPSTLYEPSYASSVFSSDSQLDFSDDNWKEFESPSSAPRSTAPSPFYNELFTMLDPSQVQIQQAQQGLQRQDQQFVENDPQQLHQHQHYGPTRLSRDSLAMLAQLAERETLGGGGGGEMMDYENGVRAGGGGLGQDTSGAYGAEGRDGAQYEAGMVLGSTLTDSPPNTTAHLPLLPSASNNNGANHFGGCSSGTPTRPKGRGTLEIDRLKALLECAEDSLNEMSSKPLFSSTYSTAPEEDAFSPPPAPTTHYPPYLPLGGVSGDPNQFLDVDTSSRKRPRRQRSKSESDVQIDIAIFQQQSYMNVDPSQQGSPPMSNQFFSSSVRYSPPSQPPPQPLPSSAAPWSMAGENYYGQPPLLSIEEGRDPSQRYIPHQQPHPVPFVGPDSHSMAGVSMPYYPPAPPAAPPLPILQFAPPRPAPPPSNPPPTTNFYSPDVVDSSNPNSRRVKPRGRGHRQATRSEDFTTRPSSSFFTGSNANNALFTSADGFLAPPTPLGGASIASNSRMRKRSSSTGGLGALGFGESSLGPLSPPPVPDMYQTYSASPTPPILLSPHPNSNSNSNSNSNPNQNQQPTLHTQHSQPEFSSLLNSFPAPRTQNTVRAVRSSNRLGSRVEEKPAPSRSERELSSSYGGSSDDGQGSGKVVQSKTTRATIEAAQRRRAPGSEARFACPLCGETFTRRNNLEGHKRAHNNEKPFKCSYEFCTKAFARAHDRKRHEELHLGTRRYHCDPCAKDFVRLDALQRHHRSEIGQACVQKLRSTGFAIPYETSVSQI